VVKVLFDTNVVVAALVIDHEMHSKCQPWLSRAQGGEFEGFVATHSLAEIYSILTRLPMPYRVGAATAQRLLTENLTQFSKVSLTAEDYETTIAAIVSLGITGGGIYDALIAQAALQANVDILLTSNAKHFVRLGERIANIVQVPI
jgi:predicted nucleic acid-binding protein